MKRHELEGLSREHLIAHAERLGIARPRIFTHAELIDELLARSPSTEREKSRARGWFGRARDLVARVVEQGLNLPEVARLLRSLPSDKAWPVAPPPLPTVTLAEIYAAQGHLPRAIRVLDEVLAREPEHDEARAQKAQLEAQLRSKRAAEAAAKAAAAAANATSPEAVPQAAPETSDIPMTPQETNELKPETTTPTERLADAEPTSGAALAEPVAAAAQPAIEEAADALPEPEEAPTSAALTVEASEPEPAPSLLVAPATEPASTKLPERYDVDEVVAIAVDPRTIYLYWEVRADVILSARERHPEGALVLRVVMVTPSWDGPVVRTQDTVVDDLVGDRFVREVSPGANVRVSLGWRDAASFEPLAVGSELTMPQLAPSRNVALTEARWEPAAPRTAQPKDLGAGYAARSPLEAAAAMPTLSLGAPAAAQVDPFDAGEASALEDAAGGESPPSSVVEPPREEGEPDQVITWDESWVESIGSSEQVRGLRQRRELLVGRRRSAGEGPASISFGRPAPGEGSGEGSGEGPGAEAGGSSELVRGGSSEQARRYGRGSSYSRR